MTETKMIRTSTTARKLHAIQAQGQWSRARALRGNQIVERVDTESTRGMVKGHSAFGSHPGRLISF